VRGIRPAACPVGLGGGILTLMDELHQVPWTNPAWREQLTGRSPWGPGVFRAFKDVLKTGQGDARSSGSPQERRLRGVIVSWYNSNRGGAGAGKAARRAQEHGELVMSDFSFSWSVGSHAAASLR